MRFVVFLVSLVAICGICPRLSAAQNALEVPQLGVASGFQFGPAPRRARRAAQLGLGPLRDGLSWRSGAGEHMQALAGELRSLTLMPQSPGLEAGQTVTDRYGITAFAGFARQIAQTYPQSTLEIGNEFNGSTFVTGSAKALPMEGRVALYIAYLKALHAAGVPQDRVTGGALHSMAGGYLWALLDAGAARYMSAVAIHPYTTAPEALPRQMAVLRQHPEMARLAVDITEFGTQDTARSPDFFWRSFCMMALAGVRRADWYPLEPRGDGYAPLLDADLNLTEVGRAFLFAKTLSEVKLFQPVPFSYGCRFGPDVAVVWGAPRAITAQGVTVRYGNMQPATGPLRLSRDRVLVFQAAPGSNLDDGLLFGPSTLVADSFDQFSYSKAARPGSGFERSFLSRGQAHLPQTCPGQDRPGRPWVPYLCHAALPETVLHDAGFVLGGTSQAPVSIRHRYVAQRAEWLRAEAQVDLSVLSRDGIVLRFLRNGTLLGEQPVQGAAKLRFDPVLLAAGDHLDIEIAPGPSPKADFGRFRLSLHRADPLALAAQVTP